MFVRQGGEALVLMVGSETFLKGQFQVNQEMAKRWGVKASIGCKNNRSKC